MEGRAARRRLVLAPAAALLALAPAGVRAQGVAFDLSTRAEAPDGGGARLVGGAVLTARPAQDVSTRLGLTLQAGDQPGAVLWPGAAPAANRAWRDVGVDLHTDWTASERARLQLDLAGGLKTQPLTAPGPGEADGRNDRVEQSAALQAVLTPADRLSLTLAARAQAADDAIGAGQGADGRMRLQTRDGAVESGVRWAVTPILAIDAGARLSATTVAVREQAAAAESYVAVQPHMAATLTPAPGSSWRLGVEHAVSPLDAAKFVALARTDDAAAAPDRLAPDRLLPDQEWRLRGEWSQALPASGQLKLGLTQARVESATELVRLPGDTEGPGSVRGGDRRQVDMALVLPLAPLGLPSLSLETSGVWRSSQVQDPLTGALRRASGEAPYEARVALALALPFGGLRWGVDARSTGPQSWYGLQQVSSAAADQTLGAFVEYRPSDLVVRLRLDNLTGGERRWEDAAYAGDRDAGPAASVTRRTEGGPSIGLSLKKAL